jgi:uncharacterized Zn finger protein (UPF0148 family)
MPTKEMKFIKCPGCGILNRQQAVFCKSCGVNIKEEITRQKGIKIQEFEQKQEELRKLEEALRQEKAKKQEKARIQEAAQIEQEKEEKINKLLEQGQKQLEQKKYRASINNYKKVIKLDKTNEVALKYIPLIKKNIAKVCKIKIIAGFIAGFILGIIIGFRLYKSGIIPYVLIVLANIVIYRIEKPIGKIILGSLLGSLIFRVIFITSLLEHVVRTLLNPHSYLEISFKWGVLLGIAIITGSIITDILFPIIKGKTKNSKLSTITVFYRSIIASSIIALGPDLTDLIRYYGFAAIVGILIVATIGINWPSKSIGKIILNVLLELPTFILLLIITASIINNIYRFSSIYLPIQTFLVFGIALCVGSLITNKFHPESKDISKINN